MVDIKKDENIILNHFNKPFKRIVLDTNVFLIYLVGLYSQEREFNHQRLSEHDKKDFILINDIVERFKPILTTPHILSEISNLNKNKEQKLEKDNKRIKLFNILRLSIENGYLEEKYIKVNDIINDNNYPRLGIPDIAIKELLCENSYYGIITKDNELFGYLKSLGFPCVNFNHVHDSYTNI